jgi:hypothetical protein
MYVKRQACGVLKHHILKAYWESTNEATRIPIPGNEWRGTAGFS